VDINQTLAQAVDHHQAGRLTEAEAAYRAVLGLAPNQPDALHLLGMVAHQSGNSTEAARLIERAISLLPNAAQFHFNLGQVHHGLKEPAKAQAAYDRAYQLQPNLMPALNWTALFNQIGEQLMARRDLASAISAFQRASDCNTDLPEPLNNLGLCLRMTGDWKGAAAAFEKAVKRRPSLVDPHLNLGVTLMEMGEMEGAVRSLEEAVRLRPDLALAHTNLGAAWRQLDDRPGKAFAAACASLETAIALDPDSPAAHKNLGIVGLLLGDFQRGWANWEWRLREKEQAARPFTRPRWTGGPLENKRILLHIEQGLGDMIQMSRYVPMVAARGAHVILECFPALANLMNGISGAAQVIPAGTPLPEHDLRCPIMSLPFLFGTTLQTIPPPVLLPGPTAERVNQWASRIERDGLYRVGVSWAGSTLHHNDRNRSIALDRFSDLLAVTGVRFFSLQKGSAAEQIKKVPAARGMIDLTTALSDFEQTAALIQNLDLVITVDTAVAHLAGALGKSVWIMLPFAPDWRWMLQRSDSPWYPSVRLFRQTTRGDWREVLTAVRKSLEKQRDDLK
jgi:tetratricopeptide (TPR) repeat protein